MAFWAIGGENFERLVKAMSNYEGNAHEAINDVLHNFGSAKIQEEIRRLMPVSGKDWRGKNPAAKIGNSLKDNKGNLWITVRTTKNYHYLYFPDDGENTLDHEGNQQFFLRGGKASENEIINRCVIRLTNEFEKGV